MTDKIMSVQAEAYDPETKQYVPINRPGDPNHPMQKFIDSEPYKEFMGRNKPMSQSLGEPFDTMDETPGSPFYDKTLNFLWTQMDRMVGNIARTNDKIHKLQEQNEAADMELAEARAIFLTEFNTRDVRDPDTGEIVEAPFTEGR